MTTSTMICLQASEGMVLCDGETCSSVGGRVVAPGWAYVDQWQEMTPEEAAALILSNKEKTYEAEQAAAEG